jgi:hypothetical protein
MATTKLVAKFTIYLHLLYQTKPTQLKQGEQKSARESNTETVLHHKLISTINKILV